MTITEESDVLPYTLPDVLKFMDGRKVQNRAEWLQRRQEILSIFASEVYGKVPRAELSIKHELLSSEHNALNGKAIRKQVKISFFANQQCCDIHVLIYLPEGIKKPVPIFLGLNFEGNHTIHSDPKIDLSEKWIMEGKAGVVNHKATEASRGVRAERWPLDLILQHGFGLATAYYGDLDPDFDDGFQNGIHPLFYRPGQNQPKADEWGSISAWAWGLIRIMDYLQSDDQIDSRHVAVLGHSRLGKAALWAGAQDDRFALVISNNSGCGGAALSRRKFGETVKAINTRFPHWFCQNFKQYNLREEMLPVDQHLLLACIAPRPLYCTSATEDLWADPRGEFLGAAYATPAYELFGRTGFDKNSPVLVETPIMNTIGYHLRNGAHEITAYDWAQFIQFAKLHFQQIDR